MIGEVYSTSRMCGFGQAMAEAAERFAPKSAVSGDTAQPEQVKRYPVMEFHAEQTIKATTPAELAAKVMMNPDAVAKAWGQKAAIEYQAAVVERVRAETVVWQNGQK